MWNKIVESQLNEIREADLSLFDSATSTFTIPKKLNLPINVGCCYKIRIKRVDPTITSNWNGGRTPSYIFYQVEVTKKMGNMILVEGPAFNPNTSEINSADFWTGWLNKEDIEILSKL